MSVVDNPGPGQVPTWEECKTAPSLAGVGVKITTKTPTLVFLFGTSPATVRTLVAPGRRRSGNAWLQTEDEQKKLADRAELGDVEAPSRRAESLRIDHGGLFNEHSRFLSLENDRRTKACCAGARRGW